MKLIFNGVRSISTVLFLAFLAPHSHAAPSAAAPAAATLLRALAKAENGVALSATETVEKPGAPDVRMRLVRDGARRRIDYLAPEVRRGDVVVDDGRAVWIYLRGENAAVQTVSRGSLGRTMRENVAKNARVAGVGSIDDRLAWIVEIKRGDALRRMWIDQKTNILLRHERRRAGNLIENSSLSDVRFAATPNAFAWTPPRGAQITRTSGTLFVNANAARRNVGLVFPARIPAGFNFESAIVDSAKGESWLRFSGARRFSIFQSRGAGEDKPLQAVGNAWFFARGGNRFVVVGLTQAEARDLAAGL